MDRDFILFFFREVIVLGFYISAPMLILGLLVGLVISIFQAMTQINEQTLTFLPKLVAAGIGFVGKNDKIEASPNFPTYSSLIFVKGECAQSSISNTPFDLQ